MRYVFNSDAVDEDQRAVIAQLQDHGNVRFQDTHEVDQGEKDQLYRNILTPLSIVNDKDLDVFHDDDGNVHFRAGVLITPDTFYVGDEVLRVLDREE